MKTANPLSLLLLGLLAVAAHADPADTVLLPAADDPTISYRLMFFAGSQYDPPGKEGLASLTARMIAEGATKEHRYEEILDLLFPMAGSYEASCSVETTVISGRIHKDNVAAFQPPALAGDRRTGLPRRGPGANPQRHGQLPGEHPSLCQR